MRFGNFVVVKHNGKIVYGQLGDYGVYLEYMGDANPIPVHEVEPLFEIEVHQPFLERFKVDDFRKFVISTLTDADPVKGPHPAITHCDNCGCDWLDNGLNPVGCPYCKQPTAVGEAMVERIAALLYEKATGEPWAVAGVEHPEPDRDYYRWLARKVAALAQQPADDEVVFYDGVGAGRSSIKSCRDGVQWIRVGDRIYWPLSDSDAKRLQSACCGNWSFDGPTMPADDALLRQALEALEEAGNALYEGHPIRVNTQEAIAALRDRLGEKA